MIMPVDYEQEVWDRLMEVINKNAPVICAECDKVEIHGRDLYCSEMCRKCYGARPVWCPIPLWIEKRSKRGLNK